ncbi:hypothetical protein K431DRAFT_306024 [Polychaeton citri CBS 116435]|uniref:Pal1-domain-containing protein n=1 Tax=Polychaeton citri CBS 116435 TaxID=1314669 RepID=A0A9P4UM40_9PEZI|nr:hypothetical protein K431DRAFT_306024 [Polychaeton citri CBS 116435]
MSSSRYNPINPLPYFPGLAPHIDPDARNNSRKQHTTRGRPTTRASIAQPASRKREVPDSGFTSYDDARYNHRKLPVDNSDVEKYATEIPVRFNDLPVPITHKTRSNRDSSAQRKPLRQSLMPLSLAHNPENQEPLPGPRPVRPSHVGFLAWQREYKDPCSPKTPPLDTYLCPSSHDRSSEYGSEHSSGRSDSAGSVIRPDSSISCRPARHLRRVADVGDLQRRFQTAEASMQPRVASRKDAADAGPT